MGSIRLKCFVSFWVAWPWLSSSSSSSSSFLFLFLFFYKSGRDLDSWVKGVWYMCLNICFQLLNNITYIFTHFFTYTYFQKYKQCYYNNITKRPQIFSWKVYYWKLDKVTYIQNKTKIDYIFYTGWYDKFVLILIWTYHWYQFFLYHTNYLSRRTS